MSPNATAMSGNDLIDHCQSEQPSGVDPLFEKLARLYVPYYLRTHCTREKLNILPKAYRVPDEVTEEAVIIRNLADELSRTNLTTFMKTCQPILQSCQTPQQLFGCFRNVSDELLKLNCSFGRLLALLVFSAVLAEQYVKRDDARMVEAVVASFCVCCTPEVLDQFKSLGGFDGFLRFCKERQSGYDSSVLNVGWVLAGVCVFGLYLLS